MNRSSRPFPNCVTLRWTDIVEGTETRERHQIQKGRNAICKTFEGRLIVQSGNPEASESQESSQQRPSELAFIDADLINLGEEDIVQLELSATATSYVYVRRPDRTAVVLLPDGDKMKCCCLSSDDIINFATTNTSIMVTLSPDVQVGSSLSIDADEAIKSAETTAAGSLALNAVGTPNMSTSEEHIEETPAHRKILDDLLDTIPQSPDAVSGHKSEPVTPQETPEEATGSESEGKAEETAEAAYVSKLDTHSCRPSGTTLIHEPRKRSLEPEDSSATPVSKRPRTYSRKQWGEAAEDGKTERITTLDEDDPGLKILPKKRGRPKKEVAATSPLVVIEKKSTEKATVTPKRNSATPRSTARSSASAANSPAPSSFDSKKPTVAFSSSGFTELPQQMKMLKTIATIATTFNKKTDILCIGGGLKKTPKLLSAVALGKAIVSEEWAKQCAKQKRLLIVEDFLARDEDKEKEWNVPDNWSGGGESRADLMKGYTLYITPSLKKEYGDGYKNIEELAKLVGVKKVISKPSREAPEDERSTILLGLHCGDLDAVALLDKDRKVYEKDFLPMSILRGELCLDDFDIEPEEGLPSGKKRAKMGAKK